MAEFLAIIATIAFHGDGAAPSAEKALELAVKQRQAITRFAGTFRFTRERPAAKESNIVSSYRLWLDGNQLRQDRLIGDKVQKIECRNCEREGQFFRFQSPKKGTRSLMAELGTMPGDGRKGDPNYELLFFKDPRVVGLQPTFSGALHSFKLDSILTRTDRTKPTLEKAKWNGHDTYVVRFSLTSEANTKFAYWIVPSMDHSVVRIEAEYGTKGVKASQSLSAEVHKFGKPGVWFPKSYTAERIEDGKLIWRDTMSLTDVTINEALPADTFRLGGMGIPPETPISGSALPEKTKLYKWDGKKIVERDPPKVNDQPKEMSSGPVDGSTKAVLLTGAGGLAVSGTIALGFFFRKRKES